jgi:hypothetical protein
MGGVPEAWAHYGEGDGGIAAKLSTIRFEWIAMQMQMWGCLCR